MAQTQTTDKLTAEVHRFLAARAALREALRGDHTLLEQIEHESKIERVRKRTLAERIKDGELVGYRPGFPPWANPENTRIDVEVARGATCDFCGTVGLGHAAFHSVGERSWKGFTVCAGCGASEEL